MVGLDPTVKKETVYVAWWVLGLSLVMEAVFLIFGWWNLPVLWGNLIGAAAALGSYLLLGITVAKALATGEKDKAMLRVRSSMTLRLLGQALIVAVAVGLLKTNIYATLIPLLFPRIGIAFRPMIDRRRGTGSQADEGSDMLD